MLLVVALYVGAFFALGEHGVTVDRNRQPMRVRIFSNHKWLCTVFRPLVNVESVFVEDTVMCYRAPPSDPTQR
jgi:hypothetical protein